MKQTCVIGTRGSKLALWQANHVAEKLRQAFPGIEVEIQIIKTLGDQVLDKPLAEIGDKGLFTKELERALLDGDVDVCVHSMKDMPSELPEGCVFGGMLKRADVRDALICGPRLSEVKTLADLPAGARIGTGSLRRRAQLLAVCPDVEPKGMRGNVDTRLKKAAGDDYDGAIMAAAGLSRLGWEDQISAYISPSVMIPAIGQGAIGLEIREGDAEVIELCEAIIDPETIACVEAERYILGKLEGGCHAPIGAYARWEEPEPEAEKVFVFDAIVLSLDGTRVARMHIERADSFDLNTPGELAPVVYEGLIEQGAREILDEIDEAGE